MKIHNFGAGPCILPQEVFSQAADAVLNLNGIGLSLLEISHRSKEFDAIMDETIALIKELLGVPDGYKILFLQGGASSQFAMVPYNLLVENEIASYLDTGVWSSKAIKEAKLYGNVEVCASSKDGNYSYIPKEYSVNPDSAYLHITTNNTIYGTELFEMPETNVPIVADMSSDIFSRPIDVSQFGLIYAGAQKNLGTAGVTVVIIREDLLEKQVRKKSTMWDYSVHAKDNSLHNTPPVFAIYVTLLTLRWLKNLGGVAVMEGINKLKADTLYAEIDRHPLFKGNVAAEDRSRMNATFNAIDEVTADRFMKVCKETGIHGIKGHRLSGGFRASMYNALPLESVEYLVDVMRSFH